MNKSIIETFNINNFDDIEGFSNYLNSLSEEDLQTLAKHYINSKELNITELSKDDLKTCLFVRFENELL
ncbi:unclassified [Brachyspira pilosicoli WesB]|uniref:Unclassified n=1 Tax=Brachyspira pilosicoli WesB TaxID=1161918 RepID=K0JF38_BRAPL|nr:hypothetical protein [Brachyspira pilosicoli]CCG55778.1 unclassified [Brachyspira pilosicoli WesB]